MEKYEKLVKNITNSLNISNNFTFLSAHLERNDKKVPVHVNSSFINENLSTVNKNVYKNPRSGIKESSKNFVKEKVIERTRLVQEDSDQMIGKQSWPNQKKDNSSKKDTLPNEAEVTKLDNSYIDLNPKLNNSDELLLEHGSDSSSIPVILFITFAVFIIGLLLFALKFLNQNYSKKVNFNKNILKPRTFLTKPMKPGVMLSEMKANSDSVSTLTLNEVHNPVFLNDELEFIESISCMKQSRSADFIGVINEGFNDSRHKRSNRDIDGFKPPKFVPKKKRDSSVKICSSDGSLLLSSPYLTKCLLAPPSYAYSSKPKKVPELPIDLPLDKEIET